MRCPNLNRVVIALFVLVVVAGVSTLAAVAEPAADGGISTTPAVTSTTATTTTEPVTTEPDQSVQLQQINSAIIEKRNEVWHWQRLMGRPRTWLHYKPTVSTSLAYAQRVLNRWSKRADRWQEAARRWMQKRILVYRRNVGIWRRAMGESTHGRTLAASGSLEEQFRRWHKTAVVTYRRYSHPPHLSDWLCIHSHEGSWTDTGAPYYGGIQFGYNEWRRFGMPYTGDAYAYQATSLEQIWAGERYWQVSGFGPWPKTARMCGLLN